MHFIWRYEFNEKHIIFYHTHHFFLLVFCCCYFRIGIRNCYHFSCYCDYFHLWILLFHQIASHGFLQVIFRWKLVGWVEPMNILTVILSISECNSKYYNGRKGRTDVVFSLANYAIFFSSCQSHWWRTIYFSTIIRISLIKRFRFNLNESK